MPSLMKALLAVCLVAASCPPSTAQTWGTYQGGIAHSGFVNVVVNPAGFSTLWRATLPQPISLSQPAGGDGTVFVSESGYYYNSTLDLIAFDALSGAALWSREYANLDTLGPPAYANGEVYLQTIDNSEVDYLRSYDSSGTFQYRVPISTQWGSVLASTIDNGSIFCVGGYGSGLYSFTTLDGT